MSETIRFVVGDRFEGFAANDGAIRYSDLVEALSRGVVDRSTVFVAGQGLDEDRIATLRRALDAHGFQTPLVSWPQPPCADRTLTHKHHPENILVSVPRRIDEDVFETALLIDDRNEVMSDHMTGQHIQGMVLLEAARQTWTAVTEAHFIDPGAGPLSFVIDALAVDFRSFVFPMPATLRYRVLERETGRFEVRFHALITVVQDERDVATIDARFQVLPARLVAKQERLAARATLDWHERTVPSLIPMAEPIA